jgi:hypothetical protein
MGTRVIRIHESDTPDRRRVRRTVDPGDTALMAAISGAVLAATLLVASMSTAGDGRSLSAAQRPEPAPPPALATPQPGGAPVSH